MTDLVIGGRRSAGITRPWRAAGIAAAMLGVAVIVAWFIYRRSVAYEVPGGSVHGAITEADTAPGAPVVLAYNSASLERAGGIAVLRASGDAHAIGAAHGRLLAPLLPAMVRAMRPSIEGTVSDDGMLGGWTHDMRLAWRWRFIDDGLTDADARMIAGMTRGAAASGASLPFDDLIRDQAVVDVGVPSQTTGERDQHRLAHSLTVVASQSQAPARVWVGRTFSLSGLDDGGDAAVPVVSIVKPEGKFAWASVGWPGQVGVVTGINEHGIAVFVDPTRTVDVRPARGARPVALLARSVLEECKTLDEAVKLIEGTPTLGAAVFVLVDGSTGKWLIVERTPTKAIAEKSPKQPVFGDVLTTNALSQDPENDRARRMLASTGRVERAARLVKQPLADVAAMAAVLRDRKGLDDIERPPGHRGVIDDARAAQVAILDPASMELWVADPTAGGRMRAFDLRHELRGEGDRPSPPADIPADPDEPAGIATARAHLRAARAALARGDTDAAAEACGRARTYAPHLPEALELDAHVAEERGDLARAKQLYQLWLDGGADDPPGEERARSVLAH